MSEFKDSAFSWKMYETIIIHRKWTKLTLFLDYGKPEERPECQNSTVEFIAPAEYMSRPPQAAQYLFILDVSYNALKSGYLDIFAEELLSEYKECYFFAIKCHWETS